MRRDEQDLVGTGGDGVVERGVQRRRGAVEEARRHRDVQRPGHVVGEPAHGVLPADVGDRLRATHFGHDAGGW
nr:hypothetical protein [Micromonospora inyonensis]